MVRHLSLRLMAALALLALVLPGARAAELEIWSGRALRPVLEALHAEIERAAGAKVRVRFGTAKVVRNHAINNGSVDIIILSRGLIDELAKRERVDDKSVIDLASAKIAIGLRAGLPHPDLTSAAGFKQFVLAAQSIACPDPRIGAGTASYFLQALQRAGIADEVAPKIMFVRDALTANYVLNGRADIAVQATSQLLAVAGIEAVPIPPELQPNPIVFSAAIGSSARNREAAQAVLDLFTTPPALAVLRANHLAPREP